MNNLEIGLNIKRFRKGKKLTQQQLAKLIGRTESSIRKYEKGIVEIPNSVLTQISKALDISLMDLLGEDAYGYKMDILDSAIAEYETLKNESSLPKEINMGYSILQLAAIKEKEFVRKESDFYFYLKTLNASKEEDSEYYFEHYLEKEGLSHNEIEDIKNYIKFIKSKKKKDFKELGEVITEISNDENK